MGRDSFFHFSFLQIKSGFLSVVFSSAKLKRTRNQKLSSASEAASLSNQSGMSSTVNSFISPVSLLQRSFPLVSLF
jgi:hypothetical protein